MLALWMAMFMGRNRYHWPDPVTFGEISWYHRDRNAALPRQRTVIETEEPGTQ